ncbi:MAG: UvrB/UvrC motif-containing protein [Candidatus Sumerlaeia bacterium]|nr:UvrB/UvrC motif-containing protein [Candidatus Sumerlaeia bacterium]
MLCQICNQNESTLKLVKIAPSKAIEGFEVCEECAIKVSPHRRKMARGMSKKNDLTIKHVLQSLIMQEKSGISPLDNDDEPTCSECGLSFSMYRASYMLGCPACYDAFGEQLLTDIRKIHGSTHHKGDSPPAPESMGVDQRPPREAPAPRKEPPAPIEPSREEKLETLKAALETAVDAEDFEEAAKVRDQIKVLEDEVDS